MSFRDNRPSHAHVQIADIDTELERVGGNDAADGPIAQALLDRTALVREVTAAIAEIASAGTPGERSRMYLSITSTEFRDPEKTMVGTRAASRNSPPA